MFKPTLIVVITILEKWWCDKQALFGVFVYFGYVLSYVEVAKVRASSAGIRGGDRAARVVGKTSSPSPLRQLSCFYLCNPRHQDQFQCCCPSPLHQPSSFYSRIREKLTLALSNEMMRNNTCLRQPTQDITTNKNLGNHT
jgi:hypothetical protein